MGFGGFVSIFVSKKSLTTWLSEYATSHQNLTNKAIHTTCVPVIFLSIVALLMAVSSMLMHLVAMGVLVLPAFIV